MIETLDDAIVRESLLFHNFDDREWKAFVPLFEERWYRIGDYVFREGEEGDALYIVKEGTVKLTKGLGGGEPIVVAMLGEGELFGEMSLISDASRSTNCVFTTNGKLWRLSRERFEKLEKVALPIYTKLLKNMAVYLCDRLNTTTREVAKLLHRLEEERSSVGPRKDESSWDGGGLLRLLTRLG